MYRSSAASFILYLSVNMWRGIMADAYAFGCRYTVTHGQLFVLKLFVKLELEFCGIRKWCLQHHARKRFLQSDSIVGAARECFEILCAITSPIFVACTSLKTTLPPATVITVLDEIHRNSACFVQSGLEVVNGY